MTQLEVKTPICRHCGFDIATRNPSGFCDHLEYPAYCEVCKRNSIVKGADAPVLPLTLYRLTLETDSFPAFDLLRKFFKGEDVELELGSEIEELYKARRLIMGVESRVRERLAR